MNPFLDAQIAAVESQLLKLRQRKAAMLRAELWELQPPKTMSETELITPTTEQLRKYIRLHAFQRDYPRQATQPQPAPKTTGMTFSEALEAMKRGERVRRPCWSPDSVVFITGQEIDEIDVGRTKFLAGILATDWEIYQEPKPKTARQIAEEEFEVWWKSQFPGEKGHPDAKFAWLAAKGIKEGEK